jgi:hypothetical protein
VRRDINTTFHPFDRRDYRTRPTYVKPIASLTPPYGELKIGPAEIDNGPDRPSGVERHSGFLRSPLLNPICDIRTWWMTTTRLTNPCLPRRLTNNNAGAALRAWRRVSLLAIVPLV